MTDTVETEEAPTDTEECVVTGPTMSLAASEKTDVNTCTKRLKNIR